MEREPWQARCERPEGLVAPVPVDPTGRAGPTKRQAAGPRWRQTSSGMYVPADVDEAVVEQRIYEQGHRIKSQGAVTGWAALRWRGAAYFDGVSPLGELRPVPLVVGNHPLQADARVEIDRSRIGPGERTFIGGIWVATVQRALFDAMRRSTNLRDAVVMMDMAAAARLNSVELMWVYVGWRAAWTGVPQVRQALDLASNDSKSPPETRMRLTWRLDAGLPTPLCNVPVFSRSGELLAIPDLLDPVAGLVGEYDGADHKSRKRHRADVAREDTLRRHGLEYFTVVGGDLSDRPLVVRRMHEARGRARFLPPDQRSWTLEPPSWWRPFEEPLNLHLARIGAAPFLTRNPDSPMHSDPDEAPWRVRLHRSIGF